MGSISSKKCCLLSRWPIKWHHFVIEHHLWSCLFDNHERKSQTLRDPILVHSNLAIRHTSFLHPFWIWNLWKRKLFLNDKIKSKAKKLWILFQCSIDTNVWPSNCSIWRVLRVFDNFLWEKLRHSQFCMNTNNVIMSHDSRDRNLERPQFLEIPIHLSISLIWSIVQNPFD